MPRFEPFAGIRYAPEIDLAAVTSPPYDVIDGTEREALAASEPRNAVHVDCPVGGLGAGGEGTAAGADAYQAAASTFESWLAEGALVVDDRPSFTLYRMSFTDERGRPRSTTGVIGALTLERPGEGNVLPHERTTPKARSDRLDLLRATRANLSAVWGLSLADGLSKLLDPPGAALGAFEDPDGVRHEAWRIDDPEACAAISVAVGIAPVVIADGHHRYETSIAYRDEIGDAVPGADAILALVVELSDDQLTVQPIHRLLSGLPEDFDLLDALAGAYDVDRADDAAATDELAVLTQEGRFRLRPRRSARLETEYLDAALATFPPHQIAYQHGTANVVDALRSGRAQAGVLLRPVTVAQIAEVADARDRMPPKTTFFWPKPRTGIVFRSLGGGTG
ncbi:MAG: DUF1015 family protein [Acidimicrobiales bacterium]